MCVPVWIYFNASIDNILVIVINFMYFLDILPTHYFEETFWPKMKDFACANTCCNIDNDTVMFKTIISLNLIVRTSQIINFKTTRFFGRFKLFSGLDVPLTRFEKGCEVIFERFAFLAGIG